MIEKILKYQEIDGKLRVIETEIGQSEERKKLSKAKKYLDNVPEKLDKLDSRAGELYTMAGELGKRYKELNDNIAEYNGVSESAEDSEVINFYKKKAARLLEELKELKTTISKVIEEINTTSDEFSKTKNQTILMQRQYKEYKQKYSELKTSKNEEVKKIEKELKVASKDIKPELLEKYQLKRHDKIYPVLYEINGKKCSQCGMELSLVDLSELNNKKIIECENCRRLIYLKD